jgi:hypothetical protein
MPLKLSESVVLWLSAFDNSQNITTSGRTNAWLEAWVMANNAIGWTPQIDYDTLSQPAVALHNADIPATGRITVWTNWGTLGISPTNDPDRGAIPVPYEGSRETALCQGFTNVNFGADDILQSFWQTNVGTIIWCSARNDSGPYHYILDCFHGYPGYTGFGLMQSGGYIYYYVGNGSGTYAASYSGNGVADYTGRMHVHALVLHDEQMWSYVDGNLTYFEPATNSSGNKEYSASPNSWSHLSIGTYAQSASGPPTCVSDLLVFTNTLTDSEVYAWMAQIKPVDTNASVIITNAVAPDALPTSFPPIGTLRLMWDYPVEQLSTNLIFEIHHSANVAAPPAQWTVLTNVLGTNLSTLLPIMSWQDFFLVNATNVLGGPESPFLPCTATLVELY